MYLGVVCKKQKYLEKLKKIPIAPDRFRNVSRFDCCELYAYSL